MSGELFDVAPDAGKQAPTWADGHAAIIEAAIRYLKGREKTGPGLIQRHVRVGFATAARVLEVLEERGVVGAANGNGVRPVIGRAWAVGDRVCINRSHPWGGHLATIAEEFPAAPDTDLKWIVTVDGWGNAAVAEKDIRRVA